MEQKELKSDMDWINTCMYLCKYAFTTYVIYQLVMVGETFTQLKPCELLSVNWLTQILNGQLKLCVIIQTRGEGMLFGRQDQIC